MAGFDERENCPITPNLSSCPLHAQAPAEKLSSMNAQPDNPDAPRILIASASVGAGHNQAAKAIAETLRLSMPQAHVEVVDTLMFAPWCFRAYYAGGYEFLVTKLPRLYGWGFRMNDRPQGPRRGMREYVRLFDERLYLRRFARHVRQTAPDLIINTHFLPPPVVATMIRRGQYTGPQVTVVTDVLVHRFWLSENVEHWFVPADSTAERLSVWGIEPNRITVSGIPIQPKWAEPLDRQKILAEWNLPADRPVVLLSGGTEFTCGPIVQIARAIVRQSDNAFVAVLAGRNKALLGRLAQVPEAGRDIVGIPFTDRAHELVAACSLMATKAGGLSTAECLAKGTPMVLLKPVPGQEAGNGEHFARHGAAVIARNDSEVADLVASLLADRDKLAKMSDAASNLYRPGAQTIVDTVRKMLGQ